MRAPPLCLALAVFALLAASVAGQMPPGQFGGSRPTFTAVKTDIPYIKCGVCETLAKNAYRQVKTARDALRPGKKVWPCIRLSSRQQSAIPVWAGSTTSAQLRPNSNLSQVGGVTNHQHTSSTKPRT